MDLQSKLTGEIVADGFRVAGVFKKYKIDFCCKWGRIVENPVKTMKCEHSNTYRITFAMLQDFEDDLYKHIHIENHILFPKAIDLEQEPVQ